MYLLAKGLTARLMDCTEIKVEMAEEGLLEPLVITEEGDITEGVSDRGAESSSAVIGQSHSGELALKKEEEHTGEDKNEEDIAGNLCLEEQSQEKQQTKDKQEDDKPEESENMNNGQNTGHKESEGQTLEMMRINEKPEKPSDTEDEKATQNDPQVDVKRLNSPEQQPEGTKSQEEDLKKVCGLLLCYLGICPEITSIVTQFADHAVNKVFVCNVLDFTDQPPWPVREKSRGGKTAGIILLQNMWEYVGVVEQILLLCQQTVCATHRETFPPSFCFCHLPAFSQAHRLTPDFPEALYELLCTLQEGRRLNDQRCSFRLESGMRRRCHSEPNTTKPANRGGGALRSYTPFYSI